MLKRFIVLLTLVCMFSVSNLMAFDGQRKGFILGGGLGLGMTSYTQTIEYQGDSETSDRESKAALMTDFKIGFAPSEQTEIYYTSKVSWFKFENVFSDNVIISNGIGAVGFSYSLKPVIPTKYITGGIGFASWSLPFEDNAPDAWIGLGLFIGGGYEFSKHYSVELDLIYGNPGDSYGGSNYSTSALSLKLSMNALAY